MIAALPPSPLRGGLLVRNRAWNAWLRLADLGYRLSALGSRQVEGSERPIRRVLVAIGGHIGDAVIATTVFSPLARAFPDAEIGVLCASWHRQVFHGHPRVRWLHEVDHWKLNRTGGSLSARLLATRRTRGEALAAIRGADYDAAIDLAAYYPNSARLLWRAGIPIRVGYSSGGGGPLYTRAVAWSPRLHVAEEHMELLRQLAPAAGGDASPRYELAPLPPDAFERAQRKLDERGLEADAYVVVHMGAGHPRKEWPVEKWISAVRELTSSGVRCVLTGAGAMQRTLAERVVGAGSGAENFVDQLDWNEFRAVIAASRLVLSVDTVATHLAGATGRPCVALMTGMDVIERWLPLGSEVAVLTQRVPCAPCFRSKGCADMTCIREVTTESVLAAARRLLSAPAEAQLHHTT